MKYWLKQEILYWKKKLYKFIQRQSFYRQPGIGEIISYIFNKTFPKSINFLLKLFQPNHLAILAVNPRQKDNEWTWNFNVFDSAFLLPFFVPSVYFERKRYTNQCSWQLDKNFLYSISFLTLLKQKHCAPNAEILLIIFQKKISFSFILKHAVYFKNDVRSRFLEKNFNKASQIHKSFFLNIFYYFCSLHETSTKLFCIPNICHCVKAYIRVIIYICICSWNTWIV